VRSPWHETPRRRALWIGLIAAVALAHGLAGLGLASTVIGWPTAPEPRRIDVTLVRRLEPAAPPAARPAVPPGGAARRPARARPAPRPASAADVAAAASAAATEEAASAAAQAAALKARALALAAALEASAAAAAASAAGPALASASAPAPAASAPVAGPPQPALDWPPSTRLTYTLTGRYRNGPLYGKAQVDWRREGLHYQVEFNLSVSPWFDQRLFSDGLIGEEGLEPRHYEELRKFPLGAPRYRSVEFDPEVVVLANGTRVPRLPQSQDSASQFVQFVWMFSSHPDWLQAGRMIYIPLALTTSLRTWAYRVGELETLDLPFGTIAAVHLTPQLTNRRPNELPFEIWTAPTLQYLPVRIRVLLDEQNFAELSLDDKPLQAANPPPEAASRVPRALLP
jgi:hypothetical protein